jgi:hypothetical protein
MTNEEFDKMIDSVSKATDPDVIFNDAVSILSKHFDTVQIIATKHNPKTDLTDFLHHGFGNYFARIKSCEVFLDKHDTSFGDSVETGEEEESDEF